MRVLVVLAGTLLAPAALLAAPIDLNGPAPVPPLTDAAAREYTQELLDVVDQISRQYVRPTTRAELLLAGLTGLYEAAQVPVPADLQADLQKSVKELRAADGAEDEEIPLATPALITLVTRYRQSLGDRDTLQGSEAIRITIKAMIRNLDPYTALVGSDDVRRGIGEDLNYGLGLEFVPEEVAGPARIKSVVIGSPAQRAGLRPGDVITHVRGEPMTAKLRQSLRVSYNVDEMDGRFSSAVPEPKAKIDVKFQRPGSNVFHKTSLHPERFKAEAVLGVRREGDESWNYLLDREHKIGYVRLGALEYRTAEELQRVVANLKQEGMQGLILDLRWSPGGFLNEAVMIARLFLQDGVIASVKSRGRGDNQVYKVQSPSEFSQFPIVVLINGETSGGSELIAAALQDNTRAVLVGQRTFGKASVQTMIQLPLENAGLKLTTGNFIRPSGKALHRFPDSRPDDDWGVRPEAKHELPISPDLSKQLREWWLLQSLRPSRSNEVLPLDDPEKDPQRQAALRVLLEQLNK